MAISFGRRRLELPALAALVALAALAAAACDKPPSDEGVREWTPEDHDHAEERMRAVNGQQQAGRTAPRAAGDGGGAADQAAVVELTWRNQCAQCHGMGGHGDGPNGPMLKAPDLTRAEWQNGVKDEEIAGIIKNGKNLMPRFDLSDKVVEGLVARIRASRAP